MLSGYQGDDSDSGEEPDDVSDQQSMNLLGHPSLSVDIYEVEFLRSLGIAGMLNISRSSLYRKVTMSGLSFDNYTHINDGELDRVIAQCKADDCEVGSNGLWPFAVKRYTSTLSSHSCINSPT